MSKNPITHEINRRIKAKSNQKELNLIIPVNTLSTDYLPTSPHIIDDKQLMQNYGFPHPGNWNLSTQNMPKSFPPNENPNLSPNVGSQLTFTTYLNSPNQTDNMPIGPPNMPHSINCETDILQDLQSSLHYYALTGDKPKVKALLQDKNTNLERRDKWGRTALFYAVFADQEQILQLIMNAGANANEVDYYKKTCLHYAALMGSSGCIKLLMDSLNKSHWLVEDEEGVTPLHNCSVHTDSKCLLTMLKYCEPSMIDATDINKRTPLHYAALNSSEENIKLLIKHGANGLVPDRYGRIPLHYTVVHKNTNSISCISRLITAFPTSINWQDSTGFTVLHLAVISELPDVVSTLLSQGGIDHKVMDNLYRTSLHWACWGGSSGLVVKLIDCGANIKARDHLGATPMHYAAYHNHTHVVELLVRKPNIGDEKDRSGQTPYLWAAMMGATETLVAMVMHGAAIDQCDPDGNTALHLAALNGRLNTVSMLMKRSFNVHVTNKEGQTPLLLAAKGGHTKIIKLLLMEGASFHHVDNSGQCALHYAVISACFPLVQILINAGQSPNIQDCYGRSPLHLAAFHGWLEILNLLLDKGASINHQDNEGFTPLHFAAQSSVAAVNILLSHKANVNPVTYEDKLTPLTCAKSCANCDSKIVQVLEEMGGISTEDLREIAAVIIQDWYRGYLMQRIISDKLSSSGRNLLNLTKQKQPVIITPKESPKANHKSSDSVDTLSDEQEVGRRAPPPPRRKKKLMMSSLRSHTEVQLKLPQPDQLSLKEEEQQQGMFYQDQQVQENKVETPDYDVIKQAISGPSFMMTKALKQPSFIANAVVAAGSTTKKIRSLCCDYKQDCDYITNNNMQVKTPTNETKLYEEEKEGPAISPIANNDSKPAEKSTSFQKKLAGAQLIKVTPFKKTNFEKPSSADSMKVPILQSTSSSKQ